METNLVNRRGQIRGEKKEVCVNEMGFGLGKQDKDGGDYTLNGWVDSKNEFVLFSFCERQFSTLTSYWCTTWVDNMNANKIRKKKH